MLIQLTFDFVKSFVVGKKVGKIQLYPKLNGEPLYRVSQKTTDLLRTMISGQAVDA